MARAEPGAGHHSRHVFGHRLITYWDWPFCDAAAAFARARLHAPVRFPASCVCFGAWGFFAASLKVRRSRRPPPGAAVPRLALAHAHPSPRCAASHTGTGAGASWWAGRWPLGELLCIIGRPQPHVECLLYSLEFLPSSRLVGRPHECNVPTQNALPRHPCPPQAPKSTVRYSNVSTTHTDGNFKNRVAVQRGKQHLCPQNSTQFVKFRAPATGTVNPRRR